MDNLKKLNSVTQTNETNDDVITNDTTQLATMDNLQNLKESTNFVTKNATISTSVTYSKSPKTSSAQIEDLSISDDFVNINTSFISSDQEKKKLNEILKETKSSEDKLKSDHEEQNNIMTQRNLEIHPCCIPGCINNADYLNESTNAKPESIAIFTPPSIENMNERSSAFGLNLTMKSIVCEKHFESEDILSHSILTSGAEKSEVKSLKYSAVPLKIQTYGKTLRMHEVNNDNEEITIKKTKNNADISKMFSHFGELSENENIKMIIENDPPISISNSTFNVNNASIDSLSNMTSNSSMENNSLSSLEKILPKMSENNSLSIYLQPSVQQSKQVLLTESIKEINAIDGLNHNVEDLPIILQNNSIQTNLLSDSQTVSKKLTNNGSFSITAEKNNYQSAKISATESTEVTNPPSEIKPKLFDDVPQTISINANKVKSSSHCNFEKTFSLALFKTSTLTRSRPIIKENKQVGHDISQTASTDNPDKIKLPRLLNIEQLFSSNPFHCPASTSSKQSNDDNKQIPQNKVKIRFLDRNLVPEFLENLSEDNSLSLNSSIANYKPVTIIKSTKGIDSISKLEPTNDVLQTSVNKSNFEQPGITGKGKLSFHTNFPSGTLNEEISQRIVLKKFLMDSESAIRPNKFWKYHYNSMQNSALFIFRNKHISAAKIILFNNGHVPKIQINNKTYLFKKAIKTKCDVENLLEYVDDIKICSGYNKHFHVACIGYFENTSEGIEACRNCQNLKKKTSSSIADEVL